MAKKKIKTKCVLPSEDWLRKNDLGELVRAMKEHPEKFAHIPQEKTLKKGNKNGISDSRTV